MVAEFGPRTTVAQRRRTGASSEHQALPRLLNVIESPSGPALAYEGVEGELVHARQAERADPTSAYQRFGHLPGGPAAGRLRRPHRPPRRPRRGRLGGLRPLRRVPDRGLRDRVPQGRRPRHLPSRAERQRHGPHVRGDAVHGARGVRARRVLDERTTMFTLGRLARHFGTRLTERDEEFCGSPAVAEVVTPCLPPAARRPVRGRRGVRSGVAVRARCCEHCVYPSRRDDG